MLPHARNRSQGWFSETMDIAVFVVWFCVVAAVVLPLALPFLVLGCIGRLSAWGLRKAFSPQA